MSESLSNPHESIEQAKNYAILPKLLELPPAQKNLYVEGEKKLAGFIEYVPGEYAWRGVNAEGYMFIHCIWIAANKHRKQGLGSLR